MPPTQPALMYSYRKPDGSPINPDVDLSTVTQADITENPYNIEFTEMNSTNIPAVLDDFDYAVITGSIVYNAGIDPSTALLQEDILPHLILQVVVKRKIKMLSGQKISLLLTTPMNSKNI